MFFLIIYFFLGGGTPGVVFVGCRYHNKICILFGENTFDFFLYFWYYIFMHYNFIEIGTSDFRTLIQSCADSDVGLSIEPIREYLDKLPNKKNIRKVNCAMSNVVGEVDIYYIKPEDIISHGFGNWVRGCNSINVPHPTLARKFKEKYFDVVDVRKVRVLNWAELIRRFDVESVDFVKIDTEGHDSVILADYYDNCVGKEGLLAKVILFEYNRLTDVKSMDLIINKFYDLGYGGVREKDNFRLVLS